MFRGRKQYGLSRTEVCPFCLKQATTTNSQKIPVCKEHKDAIMNDMKCACGEWLDIKQGKWGYFFLCMNCGPLNKDKVFMFNEIKDVSVKKPAAVNKSIIKKKTTKKKTTKKKTSKSKYTKKSEKEITITSDDPFYFS